MAIEDIKELRTVSNQSSAQELLAEGWTLLVVCVKKDGADQYAEYHLGRPKQAEKPQGGVGVLVPKRLRQSQAEGSDE